MNINTPPPGLGQAFYSWVVFFLQRVFRRQNATSGGTTTLAIGEPVIDGDAGSVLYIDTAGGLAQSADFTYQPPNPPFSDGSLTLTNSSLTIIDTDGAGFTGLYRDQSQEYSDGATNNTLSLIVPSITSNAVIQYPIATGTLALDGDYLRLDGTVAMAADLDNGGFKIVDVATPTEDTDGVNKAYVDTFVTGLSPKTAVRVATTGVLSPAAIYSNGASGVGATLTTLTTGTLTIDGVVVATNDRVLIKDQADPVQNGIYDVTQAGAIGVLYILTRALDTNQPAELVSAYTYTGNEGTDNKNKGYVQTTPATITIGSSSIVWALFNSNAYSSGTGITIEAGNLIASDLSNGVPGLGNIGQSVIGGTTANGALTIVGSTSLSLRTTTAPAIVMNSVSGLGATSAINQVFEQITAIINQSSAAGAGYTTLKVSTVEISVDTGAKKLFELLAGASGTTSKFAVANTGTITVAAGANRFANDVSAVTADTSFILVVTQNETWIRTGFTTAKTITVPPDVFPIGAQINIAQWAAVGTTTFVEGSGVNIYSKGGLLTISEQYVWVTLKQVDTNEWSLIGDLI